MKQLFEMLRVLDINTLIRKERKTQFIFYDWKGIAANISGFSNKASNKRTQV